MFTSCIWHVFIPVGLWEKSSVAVLWKPCLQNRQFFTSKKNCSVFSFVTIHFSDSPMGFQMVYLVWEVGDCSRAIKEHSLYCLSEKFQIFTWFSSDSYALMFMSGNLLVTWVFSLTDKRICPISVCIMRVCVWSLTACTSSSPSSPSVSQTYTSKANSQHMLSHSHTHGHPHIS